MDIRPTIRTKSSILSGDIFQEVQFDVTLFIGNAMQLKDYVIIGPEAYGLLLSPK